MRQSEQSRAFARALKARGFRWHRGQSDQGWLHKETKFLIYQRIMDRVLYIDPQDLPKVIASEEERERLFPGHQEVWRDVTLPSYLGALLEAL